MRLPVVAVIVEKTFIASGVIWESSSVKHGKS